MKPKVVALLGLLQLGPASALAHGEERLAGPGLTLAGAVLAVVVLLTALGLLAYVVGRQRGPQPPRNRQS